MVFVGDGVVPFPFFIVYWYLIIMSVDFSKYGEFVDTVTSAPSKGTGEMISVLKDLKLNGAQPERLITGAVGICAEGGEFMEIVKKMVFQGKPYDHDNIYHMKRELGDIMFYVQTACIALGTTVDEIVEMNVDKLEARYPGGQFSVEKSENRVEGDL